MLSLFDWLVLVVVISIVVAWLYRYLRRALSSGCDSDGCANCSGCAKGKRPD